MEWRLLENIPFNLDEADFLSEMRVKPGSTREASCRELLAQARGVARLRAVYLPQRISALDETGMTVADVTLLSKLFMPRLQAGQEIYFFLATCGAEMNEWGGNFRGDLLRDYWADCLAERALRQALAALENTLRPLIKDEYLAAMNPGSLDEWPLTEQQPLFKLLGNAVAACGVSLNEHCVMAPKKSVSGFYFGSANEYRNCELCQRQHCHSRRAAFGGGALYPLN